jgi:ATP-dependent Lhr-like helicase
VRTTPVALFLREHAYAWKAIATANGEAHPAPLSVAACTVLEAVRRRGASFTHELTKSWQLADAELRAALGELVAAGLIASDGFAGLRGLIADREGPRDTQTAGRWAALTAEDGSATSAERRDPEADVEMQARALLLRYGVVCRRLLVRETGAQPWRLLARVYRRLEARGEIRGGRFVAGMSGEQFATPEAVEKLREVRRTSPSQRLLVISAADPLNLSGIVTAGDRIPAVASTRIVYRDGVALAVMEGDYIRPVAAIDPSIAADVASALAGRRVPPVISGFVGRVS